MKQKNNPPEEMQFRWKSTTPAMADHECNFTWRECDQLMARHKANHIQVVYAPSTEFADKSIAAKAAMFAEMGIAVHLCGDVKLG